MKAKKTLRIEDSQFMYDVQEGLQGISEKFNSKSMNISSIKDKNTKTVHLGQMNKKTTKPDFCANLYKHKTCNVEQEDMKHFKRVL